MKMNQDEQNKLIQQFDNAMLSNNHDEVIKLGEELLKVENLANSTKKTVQTELLIAYIIRGNIYYGTGKYEKALSDYNKIIELNPEYTDAYYNRGNTYNAIEMYQEALVDFNKALELNPKHVKAYNNRGNTYSVTDKYEEALADYNQALELNPEYTDAYHNRGNTYRATGKYEEALSDYNQALKLNPEYAIAYNSRGNTYYAMGKYQEALSDYKKYLDLEPSSIPSDPSLESIKDINDFDKYFCFTAFLDILGYKEWVQDVTSLDKAKDLAKKIMDAKGSLDDFKGLFDRNSKTIIEIKHILVSDAFIVVVQFQEDLRKALGESFNRDLALWFIYQFEKIAFGRMLLFCSMASHEIIKATNKLLRGGIVRGYTYMIENTALGKGLTDAYFLENDQDRNPKIKIDDNIPAKELLGKSESWIKEDSLGKYLDYLEVSTNLNIYEDVLDTYQEALDDLKKVISKKDKEGKKDKNLINKFEWAKAYYTQHINSKKETHES